MEKLPFYERYTRKNVSIRTFSSQIDPEELKWHQDDETRFIRVKKGSGWSIQYDNQLPQPLQEGRSYLVMRGEWHRVIKGDDDLVVEIERINE